MAATEEATEPIPPYDPIESARFTALHSAIELARPAGTMDDELGVRVDAVLSTADRLFAWLTQSTQGNART